MSQCVREVVWEEIGGLCIGLFIRCAHGRVHVQEILRILSPPNGVVSMNQNLAAEVGTGRGNLKGGVFPKRQYSSAFSTDIHL